MRGVFKEQRTQWEMRQSVMGCPVMVGLVGHSTDLFFTQSEVQDPARL